MSDFRKTKISQIDKLQTALEVQSATIIGNRIVLRETDTNLYRFRILQDVEDPVLVIDGFSEGPIYNHNTLTDEMEVVTLMKKGFHEVSIIDGMNIRIPAPDGAGGGGGVGKVVKTVKRIDFTEETSTVSIGDPEFDPKEHFLIVYEGGKLQTLGIDYTYNNEFKTISKPPGESWRVDDVLDIIVEKNAVLFDAAHTVDGYMLKKDSVPFEALKQEAINQIIPTQKQSVIPSEGWVENLGDPENPLRLDLPLEGVTLNHRVTLEIHHSFTTIANRAGINPTCVEYHGGVTLYAKAAPEVDIPIKYYMDPIYRPDAI